MYSCALVSTHSRGIPTFCCLQSFFSTQQFDAPLSGIAFATSICTPAVTLLPSLLSYFLPLLPAVAANIFSYISNLNRSPSRLRRKSMNINVLQALHVVGLFLLNLLYIDFFFIFSWLLKLRLFLCFFWSLFHSSDHVFQQTMLLRVTEAAL